MKYIYTLLVLLVVQFFSMSAQIVINKADFPVEASYESNWYQSAQTDLEVPAMGDNQTWDLSNIDVVDEYYTEFFDANGDEYYTNAINYQNLRYALNDFIFDSQDFYTIDDEGYAKIGRRLTETEFPIGQVTGGANDKLKIVGGNSPFVGRWDYIKFPLKYEDTWNSNFSIPTNYELTVEAYGLKDTPGLFIGHSTDTRSVVGSGKLTMPNKDGGVMTIDALLIKSEITTIDSVFLGGQPAPPQLMAAFGLEQGQSRSAESYIFYSPGYGESVASYGGGIITYKILSGITTSVETDNFNNLNLFPNPVKIGSNITIQNSENNISKIKIIDQTGKLVDSQSVTSSENINFEISNSLNAGVYIIQASDVNGNIINTNKIVVE